MNYLITIMKEEKMINITDSIKDVCRRKLLVPLIISIVAIVVLIICPFATVFNPPKINDVFNVTKDHSFVNVSADTLYYTGYNLTTYSGKTFGYYYTLKDNRCVFSLIPIKGTAEDKITNYHFLAKVTAPNSSFKKMLKSFSTDLNWTESGIKEVTSSYILSNADYHPIGYVVFFWIVLITLFVSLKNLVFAISGLINPYLYPVCSFLGKELQQALIDDAQGELDTGNYLQINNTYITENYFMDFDIKKISIIPLNEIVWCYRLGRLSLNPKIIDPVYSLHFTIISGVEITVRHKTSDEALETINSIRATGYPIIIGHSEGKRRKAKKIIQRYKTTEEE